MTEDAKNRVLAVVDQLWDEEVSLLRILVAQRSTRGNTNAVQGLIAERVGALGLDVVEEALDLHVISALPGFSPPEWSYDGLVNVVGRLEGTGGGRSLLLNGHVDVVSAEPVSHWEHDPWTGEVVGQRMYGRGVCDMKSGVAAMLTIVQAVREAGVRLRGDLLIETVIDEECGGNGTLSCLANGHVADAAIVPEPTGLQVTTAHPGVLWFRIQIRGQGAHAQSASGAVNAAEKAFPIITGLRQLEEAWNRPDRRHPALGALEHPINLNIGSLHAGDWPSSVPEVCVIEARLAYYPGEEITDVQQSIRNHIREVSQLDPWLREHPPDVSFFGFAAEPTIYNLDTPLFDALQVNHQDLTGTLLTTGPSAATIDNRFFQLYYDIPTVVYGALGGALHAPDEWVDLDSLRKATAVLAGTIVDWCGVE